MIWNHSSCLSRCVIGASCIGSASLSVHPELLIRSLRKCWIAGVCCLSAWSWCGIVFDRKHAAVIVNDVFVLMLMVTSNRLTSVCHLINLKTFASITCSPVLMFAIRGCYDEGTLLFSSASCWWNNVPSVNVFFTGSTCSSGSKLKPYTD